MSLLVERSFAAFGGSCAPGFRYDVSFLNTLRKLWLLLQVWSIAYDISILPPMIGWDLYINQLLLVTALVPSSSIWVCVAFVHAHPPLCRLMETRWKHVKVGNVLRLKRDDFITVSGQLPGIYVSLAEFDQLVWLHQYPSSISLITRPFPLS